MNSDRMQNWTIWGISISVLVVILATGYLFLVKKDFDFLLEAPCDPNIETCYARDCSNPDDCPPNGLENYKVWKVSANDFPSCSDNGCPECETGVFQCEAIACGESDEDECTEPEESNEPKAEPPEESTASTTEESEA